MSKFHKKNKTKKRKRRIQHTKNEASTKNEIIELFLKSKKNEEDIEILETPFGEIFIHDNMLAHTLKDKDVLFDLSKIDEVEEGDTLSKLIFLEKLKDQYPDEPFVAHEVSICYQGMKELEKYNTLVEENYEKHQGYPVIDISYVGLNLDEYDIDIADDVFGKELNIHQLYPRFKAFDRETISQFYAILSVIYRDRNELLTARKCARIVALIDFERGDTLETYIDIIERPWLKWKAIFLGVLILLLILSLIGGIIWGIISLFQWIF